MNRSNSQFKILLSLLIVLTCFPAFAQYNEYAQLFFFGRQNGARMEALAKTGVALGGELAATSLNPATISGIDGVAFQTHFGDKIIHGQTPNRQRHSQLAIAYKLNQYLQIGYSKVDWEFIYLPDDPTVIREAFNQSVITIASEPFKDFFVGINTNFFTHFLGPYETRTNPNFDLGVSKRIRLWKLGPNMHSLNLAASATNVSNTKMHFKKSPNSKELLPQIIRTGFNYKLALKPNSDSVSPVSIMTTAQYQFLANQDHHKSINGGIELELFNLLELRAGYYLETLYDYGQPGNKDELRQFTYGAGVNLPLNRWTKLPLRVEIDYAHLPLQVYYHTVIIPDKFNSFTLKLNWLL